MSTVQQRQRIVQQGCQECGEQEAFDMGLCQQCLAEVERGFSLNEHDNAAACTGVMALGEQIAKEFPDKAACVNMQSPVEILFLAAEIVAQHKASLATINRLNGAASEAEDEYEDTITCAVCRITTTMDDAAGDGEWVPGPGDMAGQMGISDEEADKLPRDPVCGKCWDKIEAKLTAKEGGK